MPRLTQMAAFLLAVAPLSASAEIMDTLERMRLAAMALDGVVSATIDPADRSLQIVLADGKDLTVAPDNLDLVLAALATEAERKDAVAAFIAQMVAAQQADQPITPDMLGQMRFVAGPEGLYATAAAEFPLWTEAVAPGLAQYLVVDAPGSVSYVTLDKISESGLSLAEILRHARENLQGQVVQMQIEEIASEPWIATVVLDEFYECSLMLAPEVWTKLSAEGLSIGAACPARGLLLVFDANAPEAQATLRAYIAENFASFPYPVSDYLYAWTSEGWVVLD